MLQRITNKSLIKLTSNKFVSEWLSLSDSAKTAGGDLLGVQLHRLFRNVEPLPHYGGQLSDPPALLTKNTLGSSCHDDDVRLRGGDTDLHARVAIFSQLPREEFIEFSLENSVSNELKCFDVLLEVIVVFLGSFDLKSRERLKQMIYQQINA